jgi:ribonuclease Z
MGSKFDVHVLGSSSATPTSKRYPTAQLLNVAERFYLIDCGEGTQMQLRRYRLKFQRINHIFISHLHGDHYLGLMGLISSLHLLGRKNELHIFHPPGLKEIIELQLQLSGTVLNYPIIWQAHRSDVSEVLLDDGNVTVTTIPLNHRIHCCGFLFREKDKMYSLNKTQLTYYKIPVAQFQEIRKGNDAVLEDGTVVPASRLTNGRPIARQYAFCSDTRYSESVIEAVRGVDLLYHEATFLHELLKRAEQTFHTTAREAGEVAAKADVRQLLIGHFSVRYTDVNVLLEECKQFFSNTLCAEEGTIVSIPQRKEV